MKILYVEDEIVILETTAHLLELHSHEVTLCENGQLAFERFQEDSFDLILTDIDMPKMNGIAFIKKVRELDRTIPICIASSHTKDKFQDEIDEFDITFYLEKPFSFYEFEGFLEYLKEKIL